MNPISLRIVAGCPTSFNEAEINAFVECVLAGGEILSDGLRGRVLKAERLVFMREDSCLIGVAGLKRPSGNHRKEVEAGAGAAVGDHDIPFELGWVFVLPRARNRKLSLPLCKPLVEAAGGRGIFATSHAECLGMHCTLKKLGFKPVGSSWLSRQNDGNLLLFVRHGIKDPSENLARDHLLFRGFTNLEYEPDGNVPPDFLIDKRIAIEVRRLNKNERNSPLPRGLEKTEIPLLMGFQDLAEEFGHARDEAWWLELTYRRPFPQWRKLKRSAHTFLEAVRDGTLHAPVERRIHDNVELKANPGYTGSEMFHLGVLNDDDYDGGWVLEEFERNLRLCIDEKTQKVLAYRSRYPEWWLLLIDYVTYALSEESRAQFKADIHIDHSWGKVIVVSPLNYTYYFELSDEK
jgi:hypothetical protein